MQSEQYSQRALNKLCHCATESIGWRQYFWPSLLREFRFEANVTLTLNPPEEYCSLLDTRRLGSHRNFACVKTPLFKSFQKWPNLTDFTTENNTYCFRMIRFSWYVSKTMYQGHRIWRSCNFRIILWQTLDEETFWILLRNYSSWYFFFAVLIKQDISILFLITLLLTL